MLSRTRALVAVLLSVTLIMAMATVAAAYQDYVFTYSDGSYSIPAITFDNGKTVYVTVTDQNTWGGTKTIGVKNDQEENIISFLVDDGDNDGIYEGGFWDSLWSRCGGLFTHERRTNSNYYRQPGW